MIIGIIAPGLKIIEKTENICIRYNNIICHESCKCCQRVNDEMQKKLGDTLLPENIYFKMITAKNNYSIYVDDDEKKATETTYEFLIYVVIYIYEHIDSIKKLGLRHERILKEGLSKSGKNGKNKMEKYIDDYTDMEKKYAYLVSCVIEKKLFDFIAQTAYVRDVVSVIFDMQNAIENYENAYKKFVETHIAFV